jgi:hypothetical protein
MIADIIGYLVASFLVAPLQYDLTQRLEEAYAPAAIVHQITECATAATPLLIARAAGDPFWAVRTLVGTWIGTVTPEAALRDAAPSCVPAFEAARPFLSQS